RIGCARYRQVAEVVAVVAELLSLSRSRLRKRIERRRAGQHGITPADQDVGVIPFGHMVLLVRAGGDFLELEARAVAAACARGGGERERTDGRRDGGDAERALEDVAAAVARGDHIAEG